MAAHSVYRLPATGLTRQESGKAVDVPLFDQYRERLVKIQVDAATTLPSQAAISHN